MIRTVVKLVIGLVLLASASGFAAEGCKTQKRARKLGRTVMALEKANRLMAYQGLTLHDAIWGAMNLKFKSDSDHPNTVCDRQNFSLDSIKKTLDDLANAN